MSDRYARTREVCNACNKHSTYFHKFVSSVSCLPVVGDEGSDYCPLCKTRDSLLTVVEVHAISEDEFVEADDE